MFTFKVVKLKKALEYVGIFKRIILIYTIQDAFNKLMVISGILNILWIIYNSRLDKTTLKGGKLIFTSKTDKFNGIVKNVYTV